MYGSSSVCTYMSVDRYRYARVSVVLAGCFPALLALVQEEIVRLGAEASALADAGEGLQPTDKLLASSSSIAGGQTAS